jgi:hypothetical protein
VYALRSCISGTSLWFIYFNCNILLCCFLTSHLRLAFGISGAAGIVSIVAMSASNALASGSHRPRTASTMTGFHGEAATSRRSCASVSGSEGRITKTHGSFGSFAVSLSTAHKRNTARRITKAPVLAGLVRPLLAAVLLSFF